MDLNKNYGLVESIISPEHRVFDGISGISQPVLVPDKNWLPWLPQKEYQNDGIVDSYACVSFGHCHIAETIIKKKGYEDLPDYSELDLANESGTTQNGNSLDVVANTLKFQGVCHQALYPFNWNAKKFEDYYPTLTQAQIDDAKVFAKKYHVDPIWVTDKSTTSLSNALQYSPLAVTVQAWPVPDVNGIYRNVAGSGYNHEVVKYGEVEGQYHLIFDNYENNYKKLSWDYVFGAVMMFDINSLTNNDMQFMKEKSSPSVYVIINGRKFHIYDMPLLNAMNNGNFTEVDSLAQYPDAGTIALLA